MAEHSQDVAIVLDPSEPAGLRARGARTACLTQWLEEDSDSSHRCPTWWCNTKFASRWLCSLSFDHFIKFGLDRQGIARGLAWEGAKLINVRISSLGCGLRPAVPGRAYTQSGRGVVGIGEVRPLSDQTRGETLTIRPVLTSTSRWSIAHKLRTRLPVPLRCNRFRNWISSTMMTGTIS